LKQTSTASRLIFAHSLLPPPPPPSPSPSTPPTSHVNTATIPSPLMRDVGSFNTPSAPSQARLQPNLPLPFPKGCGRVSLARRRARQRQGMKRRHRRWANPEDDTTMRKEGRHNDDEGGRDEEEDRCPTRCVTKRATIFRGSFSSSFLSLNSRPLISNGRYR